MDWEPIETCPKTEGHGPFLVFEPICKDWNDPRNIHKAWWDGPAEKITGFENAIYWRPMPSAPQRN